MLTAVVAILVTISLLWLLVKWSHVKTYWKERGVPYTPPHPLLGSLTFLQKENPAHWVRRIYDAKLPYIGIWVFWRPGLVINSPELARRILVKDSDNFRNRYLSSGSTDPLGRLNLFLANDPLWSNIRRRLTSVFTASKLRSLQGLTKQKSQDLVDRIDREMTKVKEVSDLRTTCSDFSTDVIGESAFGVKSEATRTGDSIIRRVTRDLMYFSVFRGLCYSSIFFLPELVDVFRLSFFPKKTMKYLRGLFRAMVEQRGGFDKEVKESRDLLDALLKMRQEAAFEKEELSEDLLLAQAAVFVQAGFDTTGTTLTWGIYELAHQPHLQEKLYKELAEAKEKYGTDDFDSNQLQELKYLNAVIKETLRKYPPMGWLDRIATQDYQLDETLTIPAGTILYVNAYGMHMDPGYYPKPDDFVPERFMPENEQDIKPYTYMPFGEGPRTCIGKRFAYQTMRFGLSYIFLKYRVRPVPGSVSPNNVHVERKGMFYIPDEDLRVIFTERN